MFNWYTVRNGEVHVLPALDNEHVSQALPNHFRGTDAETLFPEASCIELYPIDSLLHRGGAMPGLAMLFSSV